MGNQIAKGGRLMYKNIEKQVKFRLKDLVDYQAGQVVSRTLVQNDKVIWLRDQSGI